MRRNSFLAVALGAVLLAVPPAVGWADDAGEEAEAPEAPAGPDVGDPAPEITATTWLNCEDGKSPLEEGEHRAVMLEFWGTWCGPCVRSMPKVQSLWERFRDRGLLVVAITRESADEVRSFLEENGYTMPVACDPTQACVERFDPGGWPRTYVIDRDGDVTYVGGPYSVERAVEEVLGLESSPATLLTAYLDALAGEDEAVTRSSLERLLEKAPPFFDLKAWAEGVLGAPPEVEGEARPVRAEKTLDLVARAWERRKEEERQKHLTALAASESEPFDLRAWLVERYAKAYPLRKKEMLAVVGEKRYETALDMILDRAPSRSVIKAAGKDDGFRDWCGKKVDDARTFARKGLMALTYVMGEKRYDPEKNDEFWRDISVSGMAFDEERKKVLGIMIGGETILKDRMPYYVDRQLSRWVLMRALRYGDAPTPKRVQKDVEKEKDRILSELRSRYE